MRTPLFLALLVVLSCAAGAKEGDRASTAELAPRWARKVALDVAESMPVQVALRITADMPTPGWTVRVDDVAKPDAEGRIRVRLTGEGPEGPVIQVITPATFRVPLGTLPTGRLLVDLHYRSGDRPYERVDAVVLRTE